MRILVTGGTGHLGAEIVRQCSGDGWSVMATYMTRPGSGAGLEWHFLDVRDRDAVAACVKAARPDVIIHTAYRQSDWSTTANGAAHVAIAAAAFGARLVHVSSDAVFSGDSVHYDESAVPDPITPYGAAKAAAETAVAAIDPTAVIARTSLIVGGGNSLHESVVHDLLSDRRHGFLFTDDFRCPIHVSDLASALRELAMSEHTGIRHVAGADAMSRYELGVLIARRDGLDPGALPSASRHELGVPGPRDVRLDSTRTQRILRTRLRGATEFIQPGSRP